MSRLLSLGLSILALSLGSHPAFAHHVSGGSTPVTWFDGLLSGIAHPVIGLDHLAFVIVIAVVAASIARGVRIALVFGSCVLLGVVVHRSTLNLPLADVLAAGSVLLAGIVLVMRQSIGIGLLQVFAALAGLVHGYALGESVVEAPTSAFLFYLVGIVLSLACIILPVRAVAEMTLVEDRTDGLRVQAAGGALTALGMFFVASALGA